MYILEFNLASKWHENVSILFITTSFISFIFIESGVVTFREQSSLSNLQQYATHTDSVIYSALFL